MENTDVLYQDAELRFTVHSDRIFTRKGNFKTIDIVGTRIREITHPAKTTSGVLEFGSLCFLLIGLAYQFIGYPNSFWLFCVISACSFLLARKIKNFEVMYEIIIEVYNHQERRSTSTVIAVSGSAIQAQRMANVLHIVSSKARNSQPYALFCHKYDAFLASFLKYFEKT